MSTEFSQSVIKKALKDRPWVRKRATDVYRVIPRTADHGKYQLKVSWDAEGNPTVESCIDYRTNETCLGFRYSDGNCYHSARLLLHLMPKMKRAAA